MEDSQIVYNEFEVPFRELELKTEGQRITTVTHENYLGKNELQEAKLKVVRNSFPFSIAAELYERLTRL